MSEKLNAAALEDAIAAARMRRSGVFAVSDVTELLPGKKDEALNERIVRMLDSDETLFADEAGNYTGRGEFFSGTEFLITPSEFEIEEGILFPGHRFSPFMSGEVFPSEVTFKEYRGGKANLRTVTGELTAFFPYHMLMGSEQVFDFLIAESPDNAKLKNGAGAVEKITLNVFDMREFYAKHEFSQGDALLCKVNDWTKGVFTFRYLSGEKRSTSALKSWCGKFEEALGEVIDRFDNFFDIPEQLSWAFFTGGSDICDGKKAASLDEFIKSAKGIEIGFDAGHSALTRKAAATPEDDFEAGVPEGVGVSKGETDSLSGMLAQLGLTVSPVEIDSYILDACHYRELDFETFFARCFGREDIPYADEAQQAVFLNYVEDRWEELTGNYNRVDDEPKAEIRSHILEIIDEKSTFLREFRIRDGEESLPEEEMRRLAELSIYLDEVLRMLNSPEHTLADGEAEQLLETIAGVGDTQSAIIEKIEQL